METLIQVAQGIALGCAVFYTLAATRDGLLYLLTRKK